MSINGSYSCYHHDPQVRLRTHRLQGLPSLCCTYVYLYTIHVKFLTRLIVVPDHFYIDRHSLTTLTKSSKFFKMLALLHQQMFDENVNGQMFKMLQTIGQRSLRMTPCACFCCTMYIRMCVGLSQMRTLCVYIANGCGQIDCSFLSIYEHRNWKPRIYS